MMRSTLAQRASNFSTSVKAINTKTTKASKLVKSTAPFESQGMSAAAKHRAQRLSYIQESSKVKAAAVVNGAPFNTSASVAKTNPNRAPLQHMMTNGSATTGTEQAVSVARNGGINKELASSDKRIFVVSGAKSNGRIPKKDAPVSEQPFAKGRQASVNGTNFLKRRMRVKSTDIAPAVSATTTLDTSAGPMQKAAKEQQRLVSAMQKKSKALTQESVKEQVQPSAADTSPVDADMIEPIAMLGCGVIGGVAFAYSNVDFVGQ